MTDVNLVSLPGDGIGAEVVGATLAVLEAAGEMWDVRFNVEPVDAGANRYRRSGRVYTSDDFELCRSADAVLLGALGLPDVLLPDGTEAGVELQFRLRFDLDLYAGVRPARSFPGVPTPLRRQDPLDLTIIRENTEGLYASRGGGAVVREDVVTDTSVITARGTDRICRFAFDWALAHPKPGSPPAVTCVDKANVLRSYAYFRSRFDRVAEAYAGRASASHVYVDAFCAQLVLDPWSVHVAVGENMFADIVSDLTGALVGSLGLAPSADVGDDHGVFQPAHGSAPTLAGKDSANPMATVLSGAMLCSWLGDRRSDERLKGMAADLQEAVAAALLTQEGRTGDVGGGAGTRAAADAVRRALSGPRDPAPLATGSGEP